MENELEIARKQAYSLNDEVQGTLEYIGAIDAGNGRVYKFWKENGNYWYSLFFYTYLGLIEEEEYIFGKKIKKKGKRRIKNGICG